jgi:alkaline phosphatase
MIVVSLYMVSCYPSKISSFRNDEKVKNIIFLIGDGMGLSHTYAAMSLSDHPLNIERCEITGLQKTLSSDNYITDSAAAGTALAGGEKTNNGVIGMNPQGKEVISLLEIAEDHGLATGLVATASVTHATPAAFIAHQSNRGSYEDIARDFLKTDIDVFIGGGYDHFAKRADGLNLVDSLKNKGYKVYDSIDQILKSDAPKLAGFTASLQPPYRLKGRGDMLYSATRKAIEILSKNNKGFFLMVEGSQIDWAAHAHAADTLIDETLDFDMAVGAAIDFAEQAGQTLVVVTADHETGGVTIVGGDRKLKSVRLSFSTTGHTAVMVPVYAYGPGSGKFTGIYDNTELNKKILNSWKLSK